MPRQNAAQLGRRDIPVAPSNEGKQAYDLADVLGESPFLASSPTTAGFAPRNTGNTLGSKASATGPSNMGPGGKSTPAGSVPSYDADWDSVAE